MTGQGVADWWGERPDGGLVWATLLPYYRDARQIGMRGFFVPRQVIFRVVPSLIWSDRPNPTAPIEMTIDSHPHEQTIRAVWYNSRLYRGRRNETRLLDLDEVPVFADPESTGALAVFAFGGGALGPTPACRVWVCETADEMDLVQDRIGPVEPLTGGVLWPYIFERLDRNPY